MAKTKKPNINKEKDIKNQSQYAILKALCSYNETPMAQIMLEKVCVDLMAWAEKPSSLKLTQFMRGYGIPEQTYYYWLNKYPVFKQAHWYALTALGDRREIGAIEKRFDAGTIHYRMGHYDKSWRDEQNYREFLRAKMALFVAEHKHMLEGMSSEDLSNCFKDWLIKQEEKESDANNTGDTSKT